MPRKWHKEIIAWALGEELEWRWEFMDIWLPVNVWTFVRIFNNSSDGILYRIKPSEIK